MKTRWNFGQAHGLARAQIAVIIGISLLFVALSSSLGDGGVRPVFAAPPSAGIDEFGQCANDAGLGPCSWTNGDLNSSNSAYYEHDATVQRVAIKDLAAGSHTITIQYQTTKGGKHAYDYITNDRHSEGWVTEASLCDFSPNLAELTDAQCTSASVDQSGTIPTDPNAGGFDTPTPNRFFRIRNATFTPGASTGTGVKGINSGPALASGTYAGDSSTQIQLKFDVNPTTCAGAYTAGSPAVPVCEVVITFGAHVSAQSDWGTGNSAANISGSPYHVQIVEYDGKTTSGGGLDNQMSASALVLPATLTVKKVIDLDGNPATTGDQTTTGAPVTGWVYNLTNLSGGTASATTTTTDVSGTGVPVISITLTSSTATFDVIETEKAGFDLTAVVCTGANNAGTQDLTEPLEGITGLTVGEGDNVTCTFYNMPLPPDTTSIVTTLHDAAHGTVANGASVPLGTVMHDSAAVTNTGTPNYGTPQGTVNFFFFGNGVTCPPQGQGTAGGTASGSIALSGGVAHPSSNQGPLAAGSYNFKAVFASSDTSKWLNSESACEPFTVDKAATTTTTELHNHDTEAVIAENSTQPLATSVHDKATVSTTSTFATAPTGSVTFYFFGAGVPCPAGTSTTGGTQLNSVTLVAGVAHPSTPTQSNLPQGSYAFKAVYSGDNNYLGSTSACEPFSIGKANPTVATTLHKAPHDVVAINTAVDLGTVMHDSATVSPKVDGLNITGNVTFSFYNNGTCTPGTNNANVVFTSTVGLVPDTNDSTAHPSTSTSALAAGSYAFRAVYNGDDNYNTATSACEPFTVSKASTSTATQIHLGSNHTTDVQSTTITLGSTIHDSATVTSTNPSFTIGGTVAFTFYNNGDCTGQGTDAGSAIAVSGGVAHPSTSQGPLQAGSYSFKAVYSGDTNYLGSTGSCETVTVGQASTITTTAIHLGADHTTDVQNTTIALGSTIHDSASVTSTNTSFAIGGTVAFTFYSNNNCSGDGVSAGSAIAVSGGAAHPSTSQGPLQAGSYSFKAVYGGDTNYTGSTGPCEVVTVGQANPKVSKVPSATSVVQGTSFTYTVRVQNDGTQPALNVILTDSGFSGGTITAISSADGVFACEGSGLNLVNGFTCNIASIAVNQTIDFIVTVRANTVCTPINNTASVAYDVQLGSGGNGNTTDDSAQAVQVTVTGCTVDILGTKTQRIGAAGTFVTTNLTANVNNVIQYQLTVTNAGNQPLTGVTISDTFPAGTGSLAEVSDPSNLCSVAGNVLTCSSISLATGQSYTVTVSVVLQVCTTVINQGTVDSNETAGESTNAVQVTCTILPPPPPPPLIIQVLPQPPLISEVLPARLPVTGNAGDSEAEGGIGSSWLLVLGLPLAGLALVATALIARRRKA